MTNLFTQDLVLPATSSAEASEPFGLPSAMSSGRMDLKVEDNCSELSGQNTSLYLRIEALRKV
jgi:hypothetical protein